MGKLFDYLVIRFILFLTFFFGSSPVLLVLLAVGYAFEKLGLDWLKWILAFGYIGWLFGVGWMVKHTAARMVFENQSFWSATGHSVFEARLCLSFLPIVGRWFLPKPSDPKNKEKVPDVTHCN